MNCTNQIRLRRLQQRRLGPRNQKRTRLTQRAIRRALRERDERLCMTLDCVVFVHYCDL